MTTTRTQVQPPKFAWLACPDCDSTLYDHRLDGVWTLELEHSPTCPAWTDEGVEIVAQLLAEANS